MSPLLTILCVKLRKGSAGWFISVPGRRGSWSFPDGCSSQKASTGCPLASVWPLILRHLPHGLVFSQLKLKVFAYFTWRMASEGACFKEPG